MPFPRLPLTRRHALHGAVLDPVGAAGPATATRVVREPVRLRLVTTVLGIGDYRQLPFEVPVGVTRIDVAMARSDAAAKVGIGLFDARGAAYQSAGFRGVYGSERSAFFVSTREASEAFMAGPMPAGTWTILLPVFGAPRTQVTIDVTLSFGPAGAPFRPAPEPGVVVDAPGWYRGDLHCHTTASSDAWASGSALTPAGWAEACRSTGLDFVALTDHNVVSQNDALARDAGADVLLMPGEEVTNWFHGHATVTGIEAGAWLDFRQTPSGLPLERDHARVTELMRAAEAMGAYVSAAHPSAVHLAWQFQAEAVADPAARTHGYEVWTGPWGLDDEFSLTTWDTMLSKGLRVVANGGSDVHGVLNDGGFAVGRPTTVVYAARLAKADVVAALRAGRCFITRSPEGVELYLVASRPGQSAYTGGSVHGGVGDPVAIRIRVRRAAGMRLNLVAKGESIGVFVVTRDDQTFEVTVPIPSGGGYVRADVRGVPRGLEGDMEAISNPIHLVVGDPPAGQVSESAPPPARPGPRRRLG